MEVQKSAVPSPFLTLVSLSQSYRWEVIKGGCYSFLNKLFDIAPEILIGIAIDLVVQKEDSFLSRLGVQDPEEQLFLIAALTFVIWVGESFFEYLYKITWRSLSQRVQHDLRLKAYREVQDSSLLNPKLRSTGEVVSLVNDDINQLERFLDVGAHGIIQVVSSTVLISLVFFYISPTLAVLALLPLPVIVLGAFYFQNRLEPLYKDVRSRAAFLGGQLTSNILGRETIQAQTAESFEFKRIENLSLDYLKANKSAIAVSALFTPIIRMAILAGFMATLVYGGLLTLQGALSVGSFGVLVFLTQRLLWPLTGVAEISDLYQRARASTERILNFIGSHDLSSEMPAKILEGSPSSNAIQWSLPQASKLRDIVFDKVSFTYPSRQNPAICDFSLVIPACRRLGLVGATGSGKSTIARLLLKFIEPSQGTIKFGSSDLKTMDSAVLRRSIGYVSQDIFLIPGSIRENIAYGSEDVTEAEIKKALEIAHAAEFVNALPQGVHTQIGERGYSLSGGQKQRLAIARAIVKDPPFLILDEATSAVDHESEHLIQLALHEVCRNRSVLIIAHRLSSLKMVDEIVVLKEGKIVEKGTHRELLDSQGLYARQWSFSHESGGLV